MYNFLENELNRLKKDTNKMADDLRKNDLMSKINAVLDDNENPNAKRDAFEFKVPTREELLDVETVKVFKKSIALFKKEQGENGVGIVEMAMRAIKMAGSYTPSYEVALQLKAGTDKWNEFKELHNLNQPEYPAHGAIKFIGELRVELGKVRARMQEIYDSITHPSADPLTIAVTKQAYVSLALSELTMVYVIEDILTELGILEHYLNWMGYI